MAEIRAISYAYRATIGISPRYVAALLLLTLAGSYVNVSLLPPTIEPGATVVAINVGGALIPLLVSLYLFLRVPARLSMLAGVAVVAVVVHRLAQIVPGVGIAVPMVIPPLTAAAVALLIARRHAPAVAYVAGSLGALFGADVWNLPRVEQLDAPLFSIGGAGTFDGVFLSGILAGLLAAYIGPRHRALDETEPAHRAA